MKTPRFEDRVIQDTGDGMMIRFIRTTTRRSRQRIRKGISGIFPAFESANYRLFFFGQVVSLIGTWLQTVAQGWLVLELTHSAFWVGTVSALSSLPILLFALFGGIIVDRFPRKPVLYIVQVVPMILAFALGALTLTGLVTLWHVCALALLLGLVNAIETPARHAFVADLVQRRQLASAIALNSATFNISRALGPLFAGTLIALIGLGGTFILNAVSFAAVIISLYFIAVHERPPHRQLHPVAAIAEALNYSFSRPTLRLFLIVAGVVSIFGWSYVSILPVITAEVFHGDATVLGYLYTATGIGALLAALLVSLYEQRTGPAPFMLGGNILMGLALLLFSFTTDFRLGLFYMFLTGFALISEFSVINSTIQHMITNEIRGRVMSIYVLMWRGTAPIGGFLMGYLGQRLGAPMAIRIGAVVVLLAAAVFILKRSHIPQPPGEGVATSC